MLSPAPTGPPQVVLEIERAETILGDVEDIFEALRLRLALITLSRGGQADTDVAVEIPRVPLAKRIADLNERLARLREALTEQVASLEV